MKVGGENYRRFNGMKIPSMKARTKVLASFEACMEVVIELAVLDHFL